MCFFLDGSIRIGVDFIFSLEFRTTKCGGSILNALSANPVYGDFFEVGLTADNKVGLSTLGTIALPIR